MLHAADAGSLAIGSPVYYHRIPVGRIVQSDLDLDGRSVTVQVFVDAPNDRFVTTGAHFWNASGVDLSLSASGLKVNTQSIATVIAGGVAFQAPDESQPGSPAPERADFRLFDDLAAAMAPPDGPAKEILMRFTQPVRGLMPGAPVDLRGVNFGSVKSIQLRFDPVDNGFHSDVLADVYPDRLGAALTDLRAAEKDRNIDSGHMWKDLVDRGLRAQLRAANLITGQLYVGLDFVKNAGPARFDADADPMLLPTAPGSLEQLQEQLQSIVEKLDQVPFGEIGRNLKDTLASADALLKDLDRQLVPEAKETLHQAQQSLQSLDQGLASPDSPLQHDAHSALEELNRAAASLRALADYLQRHPEALLRGKSADEEPSGTAAGTKP
jgi:paraquat-inducible protein B